jgi:hypothetical protein
VPEIEQTSNVKAVDDRIPPITAVTNGRGTSAAVPVAIGIGRPPRGATNTWQMTDLFGKDLDSCGCCWAMFLQALTGGAMSTACALRLAHMPCTPRSSSHFAESAGFIRSNVVQAADHVRAIDVALDVVEDDFLADAWDEAAAPVGAGGWLGDSDPDVGGRRCRGRCRCLADGRDGFGFGHRVASASVP